MAVLHHFQAIGWLVQCLSATSEPVAFEPKGSDEHLHMYDLGVVIVQILRYSWHFLPQWNASGKGIGKGQAVPDCYVPSQGLVPGHNTCPGSRPDQNDHCRALLKAMHQIPA